MIANNAKVLREQCTSSEHIPSMFTPMFTPLFIAVSIFRLENIYGETLFMRPRSGKRTPPLHTDQYQHHQFVVVAKIRERNPHKYLVREIV